MRKPARVSLIAVLFFISVFFYPAAAQDSHGSGGVSSFGFSSSYSADSSHILIGDAGQRRIWTLGAEYTHLLHQGPLFRLDYEGSITPLFEETDPTVTGTVFTVGGQQITSPQSPVRVLHIASGPVGSVLVANGATAPLYATFSRQDTYAASLAPLGIRVSAMPHWTIHPSMALDLGFVVSARDIPLDDCSQFNFTFAVGPGLEVFSDAHTSWRVEYLYRHVSNAGLGNQNPGIDQGVVRVTLSLHR